MKTLKSVLLSTSLLMTAPFAAADVEQRDLPGVQVQSAEALEAAFERYQKSTTGNLLRLLEEVAQVELSTLDLAKNSEILPTMIGLKKTLGTLKAKEKQLTAETTSLQTELATAKGKKDDLEKELQNFKDALVHAEQSNRQAGEHSNKLIAKLTDERDAQKEEVERLTRELAPKEAEVARLTRELKKAKDDAEAEARRLNEQIGRRDKTVEGKDANNTELFNKWSAAEVRVSALEAQLNQAKAALAARDAVVDNTQLNAANARVSELEAALAAKDEEIQRMQRENFASYIKAKQEHDAAIADNDNRILELRTTHFNEKIALRAELTAENDLINNRKIQALESQLAEKVTEIKELRDELDTKLAEIEALKGEHSAVEDKLKLEKGQLAAQLKERERDLNAAAEARISALEAALAEKDIHIERLKRDDQQANEEIARIRPQVINLRADLAQERENFAARERELADAAEAGKRELKAAIAQLKADSEARERELIAAAEAREGVLTATNAALAKELEALRSAPANRVNRSLDVDGSAAAAAEAALREIRATREAGSGMAQSSRYSSVSNTGARDRPDLADYSPLSQGTTTPPRNDNSTNPLLQKGDPLFSDDETDHTPPQSQGAASPAPAAAKGEDATAAQIATLQAQLNNAREGYPFSGKGSVARNKTAIDKIQRLEADIAALQQAQLAGN